MAESQKLMFSILTYLEEQKTTGGLDTAHRDSLNVAVQRLETVFGVSTKFQDQAAQYRVDTGLLDIFTAHLCQLDSKPADLPKEEASPEDKQAAEELKNEGNELMSAEKFSEAVECYSQAIKRDCNNAVYYCNRAAAHSKLDHHKLAVQDCLRSVQLKPSYSKAHSRMGVAYSGLKQHKTAAQCFQKAVELDPANQGHRHNLHLAQLAGQEGTSSTRSSTGGWFQDLLVNQALSDACSILLADTQIQELILPLLKEGLIPRCIRLYKEGGLAALLQTICEVQQNFMSTAPQLMQHLRTMYPDLISDVLAEMQDSVFSDNSKGQ